MAGNVRRQQVSQTQKLTLQKQGIALTVIRN
jgi:hypothetical protein